MVNLEGTETTCPQTSEERALGHLWQVLGSHLPVVRALASLLFL